VALEAELRARDAWWSGVAVGVVAACLLVLGLRECSWEPGAFVYVKFLVGVAEVRLDGFGGDEQGLGDLSRAESTGGHAGDAGFGRGERIAAALQQAAWSRSAGPQFLVRAVSERDGAASLGEYEPLA